MAAVTVVIPMRNELASIDPLFVKFERLTSRLERTCRILVVDGDSTDGSPDAVRAFADRLPVEVMELDGDRGLGGALEAGLLRALEDPETEAIITMDGDDSHDPDTIPSILDGLAEGNDVVVASRFENGGREVGVAGHRKLLSHAASGLLRTLFPVGSVKDYSSGFRGYRPDALREVEARFDRLVQESGFSCMMELLLKLRALGVRAAEVPLVLRYDLKQTESKMDIGHTIRRYLAVMAGNLRHSPGRDPGAEQGRIRQQVA